MKNTRGEGGGGQAAPHRNTSRAFIYYPIIRHSLLNIAGRVPELLSQHEGNRTEMPINSGDPRYLLTSTAYALGVGNGGAMRPKGSSARTRNADAGGSTPRPPAPVADP